MYTLKHRQESTRYQNIVLASSATDKIFQLFIINLYYPLPVVYTYINFGIFFTISFSVFFSWSRLLLNLCCCALDLILPRFLLSWSTVELSRNDGSLFTNESHAANSNNVMIMSSSSSSSSSSSAAAKSPETICEHEAIQEITIACDSIEF